MAAAAAAAVCLTLLTSLTAAALAACCGNHSIGFQSGRLTVPLEWAQRIHQGELTNLLGSIRGASRHPILGAFITMGSTLFNRTNTRLGAARPDGGDILNDLREVDSERKMVIKDAVCKPRKQPVLVPRPTDPLVLYTPPCVMIPRCSGCCSHELLECVPSEVKTIRKKVLALRFSGENQISLADQESSVKRVKMEKHLTCVCQCRVKSTDCTSRQQYDSANCRCVCPNEHEATSCPGSKIWSSDDCACKCAKVAECSTGLAFDSNQCRCLPSSVYRQTLFSRVEGPVASGTATTSGGWGTGESSGLAVDPPAPRRSQEPQNRESLGPRARQSSRLQGRQSYPSRQPESQRYSTRRRYSTRQRDSSRQWYPDGQDWRDYADPPRRRERNYGARSRGPE